MNDPTTTLRCYFDAFRTRDRSTLEAILTSDLTHTSPWSTYTDRDAMLEQIWPHVGKTWAVDLEFFGSGSTFLVTYRHSGSSTARLAERFVFRGEQICAIEVYPAYDLAQGAGNE